MKKAFLATLLLTAIAAQAATLNIDRVEPENWFAGLKYNQLELMVYGEGIGAATVTTDYPGVTIDSIAKLQSPNYLIICMSLRGVQPGTMNLNFQLDKKKKTVPFEFKARDNRGKQGFSNADVLYMLMPDRFANGNPANDKVKGMRSQVCDRSHPSYRHGGDLEGIRQHLNYFTDLGVTALWFTPVLENDSPVSPWNDTYHGYATTNYYRVDPRFGTNDEYRRLIDEAHAKGLKVVMDMIFNHCGFEHPWVSDMPTSDWFNLSEWLKQSKGSSDSRNTNFQQTSYKLAPVLDPYASQIDLKETVQGWFVSTMPDLNQNNSHVMNYLIQNSMWWIETAGIDGIRMDTYPYAYAEPMARWMEIINNEYPNFNVVGETWFEQPAYTAAWQQGSKVAKTDSHLKTVMDFAFRAALDSASVEQTDNQWRGYNRVYHSLVFDYLYPDPSHVMAFIENHDTDRFLKDGQDIDKLKQALALLLTVNRIPQLYYGTEILMNGTKAVTDGNVRKDFPGGFPGDEHNCFSAEGRSEKQNEMYNWLRNLLHWRNGEGRDLITKGKMIQFIPHNGFYVIARQYGGKTLLVIVNGTDETQLFVRKHFLEVIGENTTTTTDVAEGYHISLSNNLAVPARQTLLLTF